MQMKNLSSNRNMGCCSGTAVTMSTPPQYIKEKQPSFARNSRTNTRVPFVALPKLFSLTSHIENVNNAQVLSHLIARTLKAISVLKGL